jgi:heptosyltransferase-2
LAGCDAVLCHDSFPAHLAAALGKPVVTIFGSGEPDWFAPFNNRQRVVQKRVCPLHPCIDRCGMPRYICLDEIQPAEVLRQLELLDLS